jgi:hypothetical protein
MRPTRLLLTVVLAWTGVFVALPAGAAGCATGWGSAPDVVAAMGTGEVDAVRVGRDVCWDRAVIDIDGPVGGYRAEYVEQVTADGSGAVVPIPGGARLQFVVHHPAQSLGVAVGQPVAAVAGFPTLRSVVYAGSFEGMTTFGSAPGRGCRSGCSLWPGRVDMGASCSTWRTAGQHDLAWITTLSGSCTADSWRHGASGRPGAVESGRSRGPGHGVTPDWKSSARQAARSCPAGGGPSPTTHRVCAATRCSSAHPRVAVSAPAIPHRGPRPDPSFSAWSR